MSILYSLRRWIDINEFRAEQEDTRRQREDWPPDVDPDEFDAVPQSPNRPKVRYRCRICEFESERGDYCPTCLASTMQPCKK
jgi:lipopolysaccharide biosynthesis regulator YciM